MMPNDENDRDHNHDRNWKSRKFENEELKQRYKRPAFEFESPLQRANLSMDPNMAFSIGNMLLSHPEVHKNPAIFAMAKKMVDWVGSLDESMLEKAYDLIEEREARLGELPINN